MEVVERVAERAEAAKAEARVEAAKAGARVEAAKAGARVEARLLRLRQVERVEGAKAEAPGKVVRVEAAKAEAPGEVVRVEAAKAEAPGEARLLQRLRKHSNSANFGHHTLLYAPVARHWHQRSGSYRPAWTSISCQQGTTRLSFPDYMMRALSSCSIDWSNSGRYRHNSI